MSTGELTDDRDRLEGLLDRVREVLKTEGQQSRDADVARALEVDNSAIPNWRKRGTIPYDRLVEFAKKRDLSLDWLLGEDRKDRVEESRPISLVNEYGVEFDLVPQYKVEASAGGGSVIEHESEIGKLAFRRDWLKQKGLSAKDLVVIRVRGDSMAPTIRSGSLVMVDTRQERFKDDGIYVLMIDGHLAAKRLQLDIQGDGVHIRSDNPAYGPQHLSKARAEALNIVGRVVWAGGEI